MFDVAALPFADPPTVPTRPGPLAPLQQSALYACAVRSLGGRTRHLDLPVTGAWMIERRLPIMGEVGLISRGPRQVPLAVARALRAAAGLRHLIVNAEDEDSATALAAAGFWRIGRPRQIAELRLDPSPDAMAAAMTDKWRNRLRHARKQGLRVMRRPFPADPRHWLLAADARAAKARGYRPISPRMTAALAAARPGAGQLFLARGGTRTLAAMLFLRHGRVATYQVGWSSDDGRKASAGNLLMWRAMLGLQAMGLERIDLGLADAAASPGLARFKQGTGARLRHLGGTWISSAALPACPAQVFRVGPAAGLSISPRPRATGAPGPGERP